jgi:hypothetical protein
MQSADPEKRSAWTFKIFRRPLLGLARKPVPTALTKRHDRTACIADATLYG